MLKQKDNFLSKFKDYQIVSDIFEDHDNGLVVNDNMILTDEMLKDFKFYKINGDLQASNLKAETFKNFPMIIEGSLIATEGNFKDFTDFPKVIKHNIRIHGTNIEMQDWQFLKDIQFDRFYLSSTRSTIFKDDRLHRDFFNDEGMFIDKCELTGDSFITKEHLYQMYPEK